MPHGIQSAWVPSDAPGWVSQAESVGEISGGFTLALLARAAGISFVLIPSGALIACAGAMVARARLTRGDRCWRLRSRPRRWRG
jgi:hypothetical protein